ncbi:MAG: hypothetical protein RJS97_01780 [Parvibaculaceae bacterium]
MNLEKFLRFFRVYLMPAAVLQSVIVGGGYGTGREVVEFVTSAGPRGGLAAIALVFVIWAVLISLSFELARMMKTYNYRHFLKGLIGPAWVIYEALAIITLLLVLAVIISASTQLMLDVAGIPKIYGVIGVICTIAWLMRYGVSAVNSLLSAWAGLVSISLLLLFCIVCSQATWDILSPLSSEYIGANWASKAGTFALYNVALIPVLLYTLTAIRTRNEAIISGIVAAGAGVFPAIIMHFLFMSDFPNILNEPLPLYTIIDKFGSRTIVIAYFIILLGTILFTAVGALEGVAERIEGWMKEQKKASSFGPRGRLILGGAMLATSAALSNFGVIDLIAKGYGTAAWGFFAVYVIPVLTIGLWRVFNFRSIAQKK